MPSRGSLEQALADLVALIIPLGPEFGGPSSTVLASSLLEHVESSLSLIGSSIFNLSLLWIAVRLATGALSYLINKGFLLLHVPILLWHRSLIGSARRAAAQKSTGRPRPTTRIVEDDSHFESWEEFARRHNMWRDRGEESTDSNHAFSVLGVPPFATKQEIRKAYVRLMKRYHPDRLMHAPPEEREHGQDAAIRIRHAYDTLTASWQVH